MSQAGIEGDSSSHPAHGGALSLASPHRFVVIASPESTAWRPAFEHAGDVFVLDPLREADANVIGPLQPPNDGPPETAMPRWAVYDCAEVPGAVIGLLRTPVSSPYSRPLDPLAVVLATPHAEPGSWHLYGLTVRSSDGPIAGIQGTLLLSAMELVQAERATVLVAWTAPLLDWLVSRVALELLAARTPLHGPSPIATLMVHRARAGFTNLAGAATETIPPEPSALYGILDRLQSKLDAGRRLFLASASSPMADRFAIHEVGA